jgi:hypothetical protein
VRPTAAESHVVRSKEEKMAEESEGAQGESKEPFVPADDRPDVRISLDTPLSDLSVRGLAAILGFMAHKNSNFEVGGGDPLKDFFDKDFPEVAKDWFTENKWMKYEKVEYPEKPPKQEKHEKLEKRESKEIKVEKLESDHLIDRGGFTGPDPRIEQIIGAVAGLTKQVGQLTNQIEELRKRTQE